MEENQRIVNTCNKENQMNHAMSSEMKRRFVMCSDTVNMVRSGNLSVLIVLNPGIYVS